MNNRNSKTWRPTISAGNRMAEKRTNYLKRDGRDYTARWLDLPIFNESDESRDEERQEETSSASIAGSKFFK